MFETILQYCKNKKCDPWSMADLESVLSSLKKNKCRDPTGLINELFSTESAGKDLMKSMLMLFNSIKVNNTIPTFMKIADISAIYKGKGSKNDLHSERGIFIVSIYCSIIMKLLYREKYNTIDQNMSHSQIGARKNMNIRNHSWVLNAVIHDALKNKLCSPIDVQILDIKQCFDSLWSEECLNDLFQYGIQDSTLNLLYNACQDSHVAVRTPVGVTERKNVDKTVMQGDVWGPIFCATTIDSFGKECINDNKYLYKYKGKDIPPLSMIDDLACITTCGPDTVQSNSFINYKISSKKLQCGIERCKKMHIGRTQNEVTCPELYVDGWKEHYVNNVETNVVKVKDTYEGSAPINQTENEKYLGDILSSDGKNYKNVLSRKNKCTALSNEIFAMIAEMLLALSILLRNTMLVSSLLINSETWYSLSKSDIKRLESVDERFMRKLLNCPSKTPINLMYLEMGCLPLRFIIQSRRLNFLKYILDQDD